VTADFLLLLLLGGAAGGFINGLAGFGTALFALGFWLQIMSPPEAVAMAVTLSVISGFQGVWIVRHTVLREGLRILRFLIPALFGIPLGVAALSIIEADALRIIVAGFLLLYGGFFSLRASLPKFERSTPKLDMGVGFLGGVLGGAASLSGALPTMWCSMRPWAKETTRAILQTYNVIVLGLTALLLLWKGVFDLEMLTRIAITLPVTLLAAQIGILLFKRLSDSAFRRLLIILMLVSGLILLARTLF
jgi:uncharacterized membrane protein YfcA